MRLPYSVFHISTALLLLLVAGCGQTGKLFLRAPPGELQRPIRIPPTVTVFLPSGSTYPLPAPAHATSAAPVAATRTPPRA